MKLSRAFVTNRSSLSFSLNAERVIANLSGKTRRASLNGRQFIVAPVTLIVTGVLNGSKGPLFYPPEEIERDYEAWNHIPIVLGHPEENGEPVSARTPHILERLQMGYVFNVRFVDGKLVGEGWFDTEKTRGVSELVLASLNAGKRIELSTGLFTDNEEVKGNYHGRSYDYIARNYRPDHLAILLDQEGACSIADGCGVLVNKKYGKSSVGPQIYGLITNADKNLRTKVDIIDGLIAKAEQIGKAANPVSRMADKLGTPEAHKQAHALIKPIIPIAEKAMAMIADLAKNSGTNEGNVFRLMADAATQIRGWAYDGLRHHRSRALGRTFKGLFDKVSNSNGSQIQMTGITTGVPERANSTVLDHIAKNRKRKPKMNTRRKPVRNGIFKSLNKPLSPGAYIGASTAMGGGIGLAIALSELNKFSTIQMALIPSSIILRKVLNQVAAFAGAGAVGSTLGVMLKDVIESRKEKAAKEVNKKPVRNGDGLLQTKLKAEIEWLKAKLARLDRSRNVALRESVYGDLLDKMRQFERLKKRTSVRNSSDKLARKISLTVNFRVYFNRQQGKYKLYNNTGALVLESRDYKQIRRAALRDAGENILTKSVGGAISGGIWGAAMPSGSPAPGMSKHLTRGHESKILAGGAIGAAQGLYQGYTGLRDMGRVRATAEEFMRSKRRKVR